jgi:hypothetical protein
MAKLKNKRKIQQVAYNICTYYTSMTIIKLYNTLKSYALFCENIQFNILLITCFASALVQNYSLKEILRSIFNKSDNRCIYIYLFCIHGHGHT